MNKVTNINLSGTAYQLEEQGYEQLHDYLKQAERSLADDPDKAEIMADLERAVAEKFNALLSPTKNVVTKEEIKDVIEAMGPVEASTDHPATPASADAGDRPKRLYVIPQGSMLAGVCNGIGAYFGVDANIVRIVFVLLLALTSGFWILVYIALALFLPYAKTEEQLAEAYGKPVTAQDIVDRAKLQAVSRDGLAGVSSAFMKFLRSVARISQVLLALVFGTLIAGWAWTIWHIASGDLHVYGQMRAISSWNEALIISLAFLAASLPVFFLVRIMGRLADGVQQARRSFLLESVITMTWLVALIGLVSFGVVYADNVKAYVDSHKGYMDIGDSHFCVDDNVCNPSRKLYETQLRLPSPPPPPLKY